MPTITAHSGTVMGFDYGLARIGVSVGEIALKQAHALMVIASRVNNIRFTRITALLEEWRPVLLVVGFPTHMDGKYHAMSAHAGRFARQLRGRYHLPVCMADERLTSLDAQDRLQQGGLSIRRTKQVQDAVAAQLILENWFAANT